MNIAVISPASANCGTTTIASFIALELGARGKKTCLTHTSPKSSSMLGYFGFDEDDEDKTANPSRMVRMLKEGILKREEISEYCRPVNNTTEIYSANDANFNHEDMNYALEYIVNTFPHDFVVFDIDNKDFDNDNVKLVLGKCDFVILVIEQSLYELNHFKDCYKKIERYIKGKPQMMVVNRYNPVIGKVNDFADALGIKNIKKTSSWLYLRYNPYITKYEINGKIQSLHTAMRTNDSRIIEISSDVKNIVNRIMKFKTARLRGRLAVKEAESVQSSDGNNETQ